MMRQKKLMEKIYLIIFVEPNNPKGISDLIFGKDRREAMNTIDKPLGKLIDGKWIHLSEQKSSKKKKFDRRKKFYSANSKYLLYQFCNDKNLEEKKIQLSEEDRNQLKSLFDSKIFKQIIKEKYIDENIMPTFRDIKDIVGFTSIYLSAIINYFCVTYGKKSDIKPTEENTAYYTSKSPIVKVSEENWEWDNAYNLANQVFAHKLYKKVIKRFWGNEEDLTIKMLDLGENLLKKLGLLVPGQREELLFSYFSSSMFVTDIAFDIMYKGELKNA